ncbi:hypothetical protein [Xanthomonas theicola]|uniref:hypothetical protein n=1 Tax=Xanthomonas theicola TaxID=56464 RepID=UPI0036DD2B11
MRSHASDAATLPGTPGSASPASYTTALDSTVASDGESDIGSIPTPFASIDVSSEPDSAAQSGYVQRLLAHWRDAGADAGRCATTVRDAVFHCIAQSSVASGLRVFAVDRTFLGAALGHFIHQSTSVGTTTFLREMGGEALFAALRRLPPEAIIPLQVAAGSATMALHRLRQKREQRNPDAAARGFHNLSPAQWNALSAPQRDAKRQDQRRYSDAVSTLALASVASNIAMGAAGPSLGYPEMAARLLASDLKIAAYAVARDAIQAMFRMVGTAQQTNGGVSGAHITAAGQFYSMANIIANNSAAVFVPADLDQARLAFAGLSPTLSRIDSIQTLLRSCAIKATINTLLESADWINVTQEEANQAGTHQHWDPALKGRREDLMRVLDQSIARSAAIDSNISLGTALALIAEMAELSLPATSLLSNTLAGVAAGMQYKVIGGTWQAEAAVRAEEDPRRPASEADETRPT